MAVDDKNLNVIVGADYGQGKTTIMKNCFNNLKWVNWFTSRSFADYLFHYGGYWLDDIGSGFAPRGIEVEGRGGHYNMKFKRKPNCEDRIDNVIDAVHAAEGLSVIQDIEKLMQLWNGLIDEGFWQGGNRHSGDYSFGSISRRLKHGVFICATFGDLLGRWFREQGTLSRMLNVVYTTNNTENQYIQAGREPGNIRINYSDFSGEVERMLLHINPRATQKVVFDSEVAGTTDRILELIRVARGEKTGFRAMNDRIAILKSHAWLNGRRVVKMEDVIVVQSLLESLSRWIHTKARKFSIVYGDRLHFQLALRTAYLRDEKQAQKQMLDTFKWWDDSTSLYSSADISMAASELKAPLSLGSVDI